MKKTDKKSTILLSLCILGMLLVLAGLYVLSPLANQKTYRGSFNRTFLPEGSIKRTAILDLGLNSYYISGLTEGEVYISNYTAPAFLMYMDHSLNDTTHIRLSIKGVDSLRSPRQFRTQVAPPYFYMFHGIKPLILRGKINKWEARRFMPDSAYYADALVVDTTTFVVRFNSKSQQSDELALETAQEPYFKPNYDILEKQKDGFFSVEGMLHYSKDVEQIIYIYRYRNQYMVMDKNLNLLHRYNTLDTISIARLKTAEIKSDNSFTLTSQPTATQRVSAVSENYLYNISGILAKNEEETLFRDNAVVDVYDFTQGKYLFSFYLPSYKGKKITNFKITGKSLIGIQGKYLVTYQLADVNKKNLITATAVSNDKNRK